MRREAALRVVFSLFLSCLLVACAHSGTKDEPADLYGPGMTLGALSDSGWEIGPPTTIAEAERSENIVASDNEWRTFKQNIAADEELRSIKNNAGMGFARFRKRILVDSYYWIVF